MTRYDLLVLVEEVLEGLATLTLLLVALILLGILGASALDAVLPQ